MKKEIISIFVGFLALLSFVSADTFGETGWNNTDEIVWNDTTTWNKTDETIAEFDVVANMSATELWVQVNLSTDRIDFGNVESGESYNKTYNIMARGNVDVIIKPELANKEDKIFSNLWFSRTTTNRKKVGDYELVFNLTKNKGLWTVMGASDSMKNLSTGERGAQNIWLDLKNFEGVIPFDEPYQNTVKFLVIPVRADNPWD